MRKKRAWSTRKDDVDSQETAAFEAAVAAARDTAVKSGEFLSNAKSDLTEHRRWLKAQSAAVERDRARHERWLERQSDRRAAIERKEHTRLQRQARRERASQAAGASAGYVTSLFLDAIASIGASIKYVVVSIGRGFAFVGANLRDGTLYVAHLIGAGVGWVAAKVKASVLAIGAMVAAAFTWSGGQGPCIGAGRRRGAVHRVGIRFLQDSFLRPFGRQGVGGGVIACGVEGRRFYEVSGPLARSRFFGCLRQGGGADRRHGHVGLPRFLCRLRQCVGAHRREQA